MAITREPQHHNDRKAPRSPDNPGGRWRTYSYDKVIAAEIVQDLQRAREQFATIAEELEVER